MTGESKTGVFSMPPEQPAVLPAGSVLDRFELIEEIGRGGMGVVYTARDPDLGRVVALKVLRPEAGPPSASEGAQSEGRMLREAQAMAAITHPNVIPVFDIRRTDAGVCIAMEYVEGPTLRQLLRAPTPWPEVVELFLQAGRGLQAAHEADLCHRDFKPSNVLVGRNAAGAPRVRVVDFGLARPAGVRSSSLGHGLVSSGGSGTITQTGSVVGTPSFMSPEQHRGVDIGPASDQYAFCVSLYWGLYRELPFKSRGRTMRQVLTYKLQCALPKKPPNPKVPRWLHAVVLRGLSPEPGDRFESMAALLAALEAGSKRRRAGWWVAGAAVGAAAVAGLSLEGPSSSPCASLPEAPWTDASRSAVRDSVSHDAFEEIDAKLGAYAEQWSEARGVVCSGGDAPERMRAGSECLARAKRSAETLEGLLLEHDPALLRRAGALVDALPEPDACADAATGTSDALPLPEDPRRALEVAAVARELSEASVLMSAGRYDAAATALRPVVAKARVLGHPPLLARSLMREGQIERLRGNYDASERALIAAHEVAADGVDMLTAIDAASALTYLVGYRKGRFDDGERWYREAEALLIRADMSISREGALLLDNWGGVLTAAGRFEDGLEVHRRALAVREEAEPSDEAGRAVSLSNVAAALLDLGRTDEAVRDFETSLELRRRALGPEHPKTISAMGHLATAYDELGRAELARDMLEEVIALQERTLGPDHVALATSSTNLSAILHGMREYDAALKLQERALALWESTYGSDHARVAIGHNNVASTLRELGRRDEAITHYERALAVAEISMGSAHPTVGTFLDNLGDMARIAERYDDALGYYDRSLEIRTNALGAEHRAVADALADIALSHKGKGDFERSLEYQRRANAIYRDKLGDAHPSFFAAQANLANALAATGQLAEAKAIHETTLAKREQRFGEGHYETAGSHVNLGDVLLALGEPKDALPHFEAAHRIWSRELPEGDPKTAVARAGVDAARAKLGKRL
jgi:serine/threonine-protein kinase